MKKKNFNCIGLLENRPQNADDFIVARLTSSTQNKTYDILLSSLFYV